MSGMITGRSMAILSLVDEQFIMHDYESSVSSRSPLVLDESHRELLPGCSWLFRIGYMYSKLSTLRNWSDKKGINVFQTYKLGSSDVYI
jgi:hypothetical protein